MLILSGIILVFVTEQKNYAFSPSLSVQPSSAVMDNNTDAVRVKLSGDLEEVILDLIKKETSRTTSAGYISHRLNARKLMVCSYILSAATCVIIVGEYIRESLGLKPVSLVNKN